MSESTEEKIEVELYSTDPDAVFSVRWTVQHLPGGTHDLEEKDGRFFIKTNNPRFVRFAVVEQGYVKRLIE